EADAISVRPAPRVEHMPTKTPVIGVRYQVILDRLCEALISPSEFFQPGSHIAAYRRLRRRPDDEILPVLKSPPVNVGLPQRDVSKENRDTEALKRLLNRRVDFLGRNRPAFA